MKNVYFGNPGKIDPAAWATFGISAKGSEGAIGQFGTGLKYAIAILLRNGRAISIKSGEETYVFSTRTFDFRGKSFQQVTCNDIDLPFTTELGKHWELWQAYRELYSNCLDEQGGMGTEFETVIEAELGDIVHSDIFISPDRIPDLVSEDCIVYGGSSPYVYRKGIRAYTLPTPSKFTYDLPHATLTEDRTLASPYEIARSVSSGILGSSNALIIKGFLLDSQGFLEESLDCDWSRVSPSSTTKDVYESVRRMNVYIQPSAKKKIIQSLGKREYEVEELDGRESLLVQKAADFCERIGHKIRYPVKKVVDFNISTLAMACRETNTIYLSDKALSMGLKQVASTLIEENLHIFKGLQDNTYEMQTYLFDQIVTMGEKLTGEIL